MPKKILTLVLILFNSLNVVFAQIDDGVKNINTNKNEYSSQKQPSWAVTNLTINEEIYIWRTSYPDVKFDYSWDEEVSDWKIVVTNYGKSKVFYWCNGLYLPKELLSKKDSYWNVITPYKNEILNPKNFSEEQIEKIREFGSTKNRRNGKVSSKAIYDAIYDSSDRKSTESHIKEIKFLNRYPNVHEYLHEPLKRVEKKILKLSLANKRVKEFVNTISSCGGYNWREIRDSNTRSFHSYGIALDILPKAWGKKIIYWGFEKNSGNKDWMLIPIEKRWMPPKEVIDIFLEEGFIWGGNWAIWDNMHFEYHPELTYFAKKKIKANKSVILLNGKWDYYDSQFISPDYFYKDGKIQDFDKSLYDRKTVELPYQLDNKQGFATYHYRLENLKPLTEYSIIIYKSVYSEGDLFINGEQIYGNSVKKSYDKKTKEIRDYRVKSFYTDSFGNLDFVYHIRNDKLSRGGILAIPQIGSPKYYRELIITEISFKYFIIGFLLIIAFYNLFIFFMNVSQKMFFYLTLLCIDLVIVVASLDFSLFGYVLNTLPIAVTFKITLCSLALIIPLYNLYATSLYEIKSKRNVFIIIAGFVISFLVLILDMRILSKLVFFMMICLYLLSLYLCLIIYKKRRRPKYFYLINIIIIILMLCGSAYSLIFTMNNFGKGLLFKLAILIFAFFQSILAAIKRNLISLRGRRKVNLLERFNLSLSRFSSKNVMAMLQAKNILQIKSGDNLICDGMVLCVKIRDYYTATNEIDENELNSFLVRYYEIASKSASECGGFVVKFYSEEIMILFNGKTSEVVKCAILIKHQIEGLKATITNDKIKNLLVDMVIDSDKLVVGILGTEDHIAPVVCSNLYSKLSELIKLNKELSFDILITDYAMSFCRTFTDCLFDGTFVNLNKVKSLVYKIYPFEETNYNKYRGNV